MIQHPRSWHQEKLGILIHIKGSKIRGYYHHTNQTPPGKYIQSTKGEWNANGWPSRLKMPCTGTDLELPNTTDITVTWETIKDNVIDRELRIKPTQSQISKVMVSF